MANAKQIIEKAQAESGEYVTGYKSDITIITLGNICEALWNRAKNLCYTFVDWRLEVAKVIGSKNYKLFLVDIIDFQQVKMEKGKYFKFGDQRYCC